MRTDVINDNKPEAIITPEHAAVFTGVSDSYTVMDYVKAVSHLIGSTHIHSVYRNGPCIKIYFKDKKYVFAVINAGLVIKQRTADVEYAIPPASKIVISKVDPLIPDGTILGLLNTYGSLESGIIHNKFSSDPEYAHIRSDVRHVYMKIRKNITVPSKLKLEYNNFLYEIELSVEEPVKDVHRESNQLENNTALQNSENSIDTHTVKRNAVYPSETRNKYNRKRQKFVENKMEKDCSNIELSKTKSRPKSKRVQHAKSNSMLRNNSLQNLEINMNIDAGKHARAKALHQSAVRNCRKLGKRQKFAKNKKDMKSEKSKKRSAEVAYENRKKKLCKHKQNDIKYVNGESSDGVSSACKWESKKLPKLAHNREVDINQTESMNEESSSIQKSASKVFHALQDKPAMSALNAIDLSCNRSPVSKVTLCDSREVILEEQKAPSPSCHKSSFIHSNDKAEKAKAHISVGENHVVEEKVVAHIECVETSVHGVNSKNSASVSCQTTEGTVKQENGIIDSDNLLEPVNISNQNVCLKRKSCDNIVPKKDTDYTSVFLNEANSRIPVVDLSKDRINCDLPYIVTLTSNTSKEEPLFFNESIIYSTVEISSDDDI